jgi:tRNA(Ile)-lysidine synthase
MRGPRPRETPPLGVFGAARLQFEARESERGNLRDVDEVHARISEFLRREGIPRSFPILVAVSGGADSVALLHALVAIGQRAAAAHVHHGLRGDEADADLESVAAHARALGVPFHAARVDAARRDGRSPEARARELRYAALGELRAELGYACVATAHTLDDQAETVLLRAIRGTGPAGLAAIAPRSGQGRVLRPVLELRREELRGYLRVRCVPWREDSTNRDPRVPRNRLRTRVLPELEAAHPGAARKLAELARAAREPEAWLEREAERSVGRAVREGGGGVWLEPAPLLELPEPLLYRVLSGLLARVGLADSVTRSHLERMARFLSEAGGGKRLSLPGARLLLRSGSRFWLGSEPGPEASSRPREPISTQEAAGVWSADAWPRAHGGLARDPPTC